MQGITLEAGPMEAIISGGISFFTLKAKGKIKSGQRFLLYKDLKATETADNMRLTLKVPNGKDFSKNTKIRYQGIEVGHLTELHFNADLDQVVCRAIVEKNAEKLFREDTVLYLVGPQIDLSGVRNLDTVLSGAYIALRPGTGKPASEFTVIPQGPGTNEIYPGLNIILESETLGSLKPGRPIYYRQVPVGQITGYKLSKSGKQVWVTANIMPEYKHLVRSGTKFWNVSGIEITGGVFGGMNVSTESLEAFLTGGVALATPEGEEMGNPVASGVHFVLAKKVEKGWKSWAPDLSTYPHITPNAKKTKAALQKGAKAVKMEGAEGSPNL
jgi:paraquat-inducible protein B